MNEYLDKMTFDLSQASNELKVLVAALSSGKEILFLQDGKPAAKLVSLQKPQEEKTPHNDNGKTQETWHPRDFDRPLPENLTQALLERFSSHPLTASGTEQD